MESYNSIFNTLENIRTNYGLEGPSLVMLNRLLATSLYENQIANISDLLESSFSRMQNLDNKISHAYKIGYSVFRGSNQRIKFKNVTCLTSQNINKFDVLCSFENFDLVAADDIKFDKSVLKEVTSEGQHLTNIMDVECIVCMKGGSKKFISPKLKESQLIVDIVDDMNNPLTNISEDCQVRLIRGGEFTTLKSTNNYFDRFEPNDKNRLDGMWVQVMTDKGYSVKVINPHTKVDSPDYLIGLNFEDDDRVEFKYVEYTSNELDISKIKYLTGFDMNKRTEIISIPHSPRESDLLSIYANALRTHLKSIYQPNLSEFKNITMDQYSLYFDNCNIVKDNFEKVGLVLTTPDFPCIFHIKGILFDISTGEPKIFEDYNNVDLRDLYVDIDGEYKGRFYQTGVVDSTADDFDESMVSDSFFSVNKRTYQCYIRNRRFRTVSDKLGTKLIESGRYRLWIEVRIVDLSSLYNDDITDFCRGPGNFKNVYRVNSDLLDYNWSIRDLTKLYPIQPDSDITEVKSDIVNVKTTIKKGNETAGVSLGKKYKNRIKTITFKVNGTIKDSGWLNVHRGSESTDDFYTLFEGNQSKSGSEHNLNFHDDNSNLSKLATSGKLKETEKLTIIITKITYYVTPAQKDVTIDDFSGTKYIIFREKDNFESAYIDNTISDTGNTISVNYIQLLIKASTSSSDTIKLKCKFIGYMGGVQQVLKDYGTVLKVKNSSGNKYGLVEYYLYYHDNPNITGIELTTAGGSGKLKLKATLKTSRFYDPSAAEGDTIVVDHTVDKKKYSYERGMGSDTKSFSISKKFKITKIYWWSNSANYSKPHPHAQNQNTDFSVSVGNTEIWSIETERQDHPRGTVTNFGNKTIEFNNGGTLKLWIRQGNDKQAGIDVTVEETTEETVTITTPTVIYYGFHNLVDSVDKSKFKYIIKSRIDNVGYHHDDYYYHMSTVKDTAAYQLVMIPDEVLNGLSIDDYGKTWDIYCGYENRSEEYTSSANHGLFVHNYQYYQYFTIKVPDDTKNQNIRISGKLSNDDESIIISIKSRNILCKSDTGNNITLPGYYVFSDSNSTYTSIPDSANFISSRVLATGEYFTIFIPKYYNNSEEPFEKFSFNISYMIKSSNYFLPETETGTERLPDRIYYSSSDPTYVKRSNYNQHVGQYTGNNGDWVKHSTEVTGNNVAYTKSIKLYLVNYATSGHDNQIDSITAWTNNGSENHPDLFNNVSLKKRKTHTQSGNLAEGNVGNSYTDWIGTGYAYPEGTDIVESGHYGNAEFSEFKKISKIYAKIKLQNMKERSTVNCTASWNLYDYRIESLDQYTGDSVNGKYWIDKPESNIQILDYNGSPGTLSIHHLKINEYNINNCFYFRGDDHRNIDQDDFENRNGSSTKLVLNNLDEMNVVYYLIENSKSKITLMDYATKTFSERVISELSLGQYLDLALPFATVYLKWTDITNDDGELKWEVILSQYQNYPLFSESIIDIYYLLKSEEELNKNGIEVRALPDKGKYSESWFNYFTQWRYDNDVHINLIEKFSQVDIRLPIEVHYTGELIDTIDNINNYLTSYIKSIPEIYNLYTIVNEISKLDNIIYCKILNDSEAFKVIQDYEYLNFDLNSITYVADNK